MYLKDFFLLKSNIHIHLSFHLIIQNFDSTILDY